MTRALRARHRHAVTALAVLLPAGLAIALAARPAPLPALTLDQDGHAAGAGEPLTVAWQGRAGDQALAIAARVGWSASASTGTPLLDLEVRSASGQPELLAFWSAAPAAGDGLPDGSTLLGPVPFHAPRRFVLPDDARASAGNVVLYSVARGRVAGAIAVPAAARIPGQGDSR